MINFKNYKIKECIMGKIDKDEDLFLSLEKFLNENNIKTGFIQGIGAIQKGVVGYYNQLEKKYQTIQIQYPMEILSFHGNISLKEGKIFPHCHLTLGDATGKVLGGHLMEGCKVFAFEFVVVEFEGAALIRGFDKETHLPLWMFS